MYQICSASILAGCRLKGPSGLAGARDTRGVRIQGWMGGGLRSWHQIATEEVVTVP